MFVDRLLSQTALAKKARRPRSIGVAESQNLRSRPTLSHFARLRNELENQSNNIDSFEPRSILKNASSLQAKKRKVHFLPEEILEEIHILSPKSCFKRSEEELYEIERLREERWQEKQQAMDRMDEEGVSPIFKSDYTYYIEEDQDDDDVQLFRDTSVWKDFHENNFRDDDQDDGGDPMPSHPQNIFDSKFSIR